MPEPSTASSSSSSSNSARPEISAIAPRPTNRALIVGMTGSGKTTLARQFIWDALERRDRFVVAIDMKGTLEITPPRGRTAELVTTLEAMMRCPAELIVYRPGYAESQNETTQGKVWEWLYRRQYTTIYVDETAAVTNGDVFPFYYGAILMRGRELGLELWSATQRPTRIPQVTLSESEDVYAFRLRLPQDRARVEALTAIPSGTIEQLEKRQFIYAPQDGDVSGKMILNLGG